MISNNIKTDAKQEIKGLVVLSYKLSQKYLLKRFQYSMKQACIFNSILVGILSSLIFSIKNRR